MIKPIKDLNIDNIPCYELTRGDSFQFKVEIKDGINADKVATIRARMSDENWYLKFEQNFFQQGESLWYLDVKSDTTLALKLGEHHLDFEIEYTDHSKSTVYKSVVYVLPRGRQEVENGISC